MDSVPEKTCGKCGVTHPATTEFWGRNKAGKHGLKSICKPCTNAANRFHHAATLERQSVRGKAYYQRNKTAMGAKNKAWRERNPDRMRFLLRKWEQANPEKVRAKIHKRRARIKNSPGVAYTAYDVRQQFVAQKNKCYWCSTSLDPQDRASYQIDHIIPLSKGGANDVGNICIACTACNQKKNAQMPHEFIGRLF